uniref:Polyadenylate-binding protein-interacting protein 1 n=1 Tax=Pavo cristatus TaxID=9049 RepID=A0A8C9FBC5_PAVCR
MQPKTRIPSGSRVSLPTSGPEMAKPQVAVTPVAMSKLSVKAPEFYPSGYNPNFNQNLDSSFEDGYGGYLTLAEYVQDFLNHLTEQPGCFETEIEQFAETLNGWVITDEALQELVDLIYQQVACVFYFISWIGCLLLPSVQDMRRTEFENRDEAAKGDEATRKQFHAFVLFLGELYLNLEVGRKLFFSWLFINFCCQKNVLTCMVFLFGIARDVKHMLLKLVELRSSNWGRVLGNSSHTEATPENDPNYFMNEPTFYTSDGIPFTAADPGTSCLMYTFFNKL